MKVLRLCTFLSAFPLLWSAASAQVLSPVHPPSLAHDIPNEWERVPATPAPLSKSSAAAPLNLRGGATSTGLQGFYDYQSNGAAPTWIRVNPANPDEIHVVYMRAENGGSIDQVGPSRRVGYSVSTDGGKTWTPTPDISGVGLRLGFPYIQLTDLGSGLSPLIASHGDPDGSGVRTLFFADIEGTMTRIYDMNRTAPSGRAGEDGSGIIWPGFVTNADNSSVQTVVGSLSFRTGESPAPLQVATADFNQAQPAPWRNIYSDSIATATSGGRYIIARAPSGKIGVAFHQFLDFGDGSFGAIRFTESTNNGQTWSEPEIIFTEDITNETNENGDQDTIAPGTTLDFTYMGEDPHIVFGATINSLFRYQSVYHWSGSTGQVVKIATTDIDSARGIINHPSLLFQPGGVMGLAYPTIAVGDDGKHIVVAYMAQGQIDTDEDPLNQVLQLINSPEGFGYHRIWMVGSRDGGQSWGANHILQDWAGDDDGETDSASVEYPSLNDICRVEDGGSGEVTIDLAFQARRTPGMYAFIVEDLNGDGTNDDPATRGPIQETFQYHQRTVLTSDMFNSSLSVDDDKESGANSAEITCYPNPASSSATLVFSTPRTGIASLKIYDAVGREIRTIVDNERLYGATHVRELDLGSLVPGSYRVVLTQGETVTSRMLNVVR